MRILRFLQDLLRMVAYDTLAKADRKARHLAGLLGQYFEWLFQPA